ncbi:intradiol ring-cleavage dioxygenase [Hymenobacter sp. BT683]|uniref:Intradiol ring-cleavage dioxygenase n=1 Tax=Hymenobacter jeongseonensis TaxID=2791027 RepID=A0ABS0IDW9_9BACT|nr:intradiol ring-cleavage dioxygenase [Hymenobacter jeongseonensis]MBF9236550.1 intradiol ring-cleavage dioxygenase [Hymenobacter jeongseonensis]
MPSALIFRVCLSVLLASCGQASSTTSEAQRPSAQSPNDACDNPDADVSCCFVNAPKTLNKVMAITGSRPESGEKLVLTGTIFKADGKTPYPNVLLYAYHTDSKGYYSKTGTETGIQKWHGRLHGWCQTDQQGRYEIRTIRPARYPNNTIPAHIHAALKEPGGKQPYYISDFVFKDDALVNDNYLKTVATSAGGTGMVAVAKSATGTWTGQRNFAVPR